MVFVVFIVLFLSGLFLLLLRPWEKSNRDSDGYEHIEEKKTRYERNIEEFLKKN